jgi:hypothetical protein
VTIARDTQILKLYLEEGYSADQVARRIGVGRMVVYGCLRRNLCVRDYTAAQHQRRDPVGNFWKRVDKGDGTGCWLWTGARTPGGYGHFKGWIDKSSSAHRFSYELLVGPIAPGLEIDHLCRNTSCVRPDHLEAVTHAVNVSRNMSPIGINSRKTHCNRGHPFDEANTYVWYKHGRRCRHCRACMRATAARGAARKRARLHQTRANGGDLPGRKNPDSRRLAGQGGSPAV